VKLVLSEKFLTGGWKLLANMQHSPNSAGAFLV